MTFNEMNTTENAIVGQLSQLGWGYVPGPSLPRDETDVMVESWVSEALIRLTPEIAARPEYAEDVIHRLRGIIVGARTDGLVAANEMFASWLRGEHSMPFGADGEHVPVRLVDFDNPSSNRFTVTQQFTFARGRVERRPDIVLLVNGIPLVVGEVKTPVRPAVTWADGAKDFIADYWPSTPQLYVPNVLCFASEGKEYRYAAIGADYRFWHMWRHTEDPDAELPGLPTVLAAVSRMLTPENVLELLKAFTIYPTGESGRRSKVIARYQQVEAANQIVERVVEGRRKRGLIWHFQGSGKSFLMVFAAQLLQSRPELRNPTVIIVVDRINLDSQIGATFDAADVANVVKASSRKELEDLLRRDTRQTLITTIFKFAEADGVLNDRDNIIVLVDEAHRTQEGDVGRKMRAALPNAFMFGLTGTPISRKDRNTFVAFGDPDDEGGYLNRYTYAQAIADEAILPVRFEPRLVELRVDREAIDKGFEDLAAEHDLSVVEKAELSKRAGRLSVLLKDPDRLAAIADDIAVHFESHIEPSGLKGMVVAIDREACVRMKQLLDDRIGPEATEVVMTATSTDVENWSRHGLDVERTEWERWSNLDKDRSALEHLLDRYEDPLDPLQLLIVTNKLLTGFDAPICQVMYLDKPLRDHSLLQAICRTNRLNEGKRYGLVVDYLGVFDEIAAALDYDPEEIEGVVANVEELKALFPAAMAKALAHFPGVDRTVSGFEGLIAAQDCLDSQEKRDAFALDYSVVTQLWEVVAPDPVLVDYEDDYRWLADVYESIRPPSGIGKLVWEALGPKTVALVHDNVDVERVNTDLESIMLDAELILQADDPEQAAKEVEVSIRARLHSHSEDPRFEALGERLERIRYEYEQGVLIGLEYLKEVLAVATDVVKTEQETEVQLVDEGRRALSQVFEETRTDQTPETIAQIVEDIDQIVNAARFDGWQDTKSGDRNVQQAISSTLLRYRLHKDRELFDKVYIYVRQYY